MEESIYIIKDKAAESQSSFNTLLKEGISYLHEICGHLWTDFNEHDPGITMLEQFCYAITSLSYLCETPIRDLLTDAQTQRIDHERQALFLPKDIYTVNPVTANDFRKLLLDRIDVLENVWMEKSEQGTLNGLYNIVAYAAERIEPGLVMRKIKEVYISHRCLGEDVNRIQILRHATCRLSVEVLLKNDASAEYLMAQVLFATKLFLAPTPKRQCLQELMQDNIPPEQIFEGPLLHNGFIADNQLQPRATSLEINELRKVLLALPGVAGIRNLMLMVAQQAVTGTISVPPDTVYVLDTHLNQQEPVLIRFKRNGIDYQPNLLEVKMHFNELQSRHNQKPELSLQYDEYYGMPQGTYKPVNKYYSIQNNFPYIYGIGPFQLPADATPERRAQAKQLKAYLLFFEQLMANFQAQLAYYKDLFSINEITQTYQYQSLAGIVPNVLPVLKKGSLLHSNAGAGQLNCMGYEQGLKKLVQMLDPFFDRRNRFLDYLLAMYAEKISYYDVSPFNCRGDEVLTDETLIATKLRLLTELVRYTHNRGKGSNYLADFDWGTGAGMAIRIRALLRMDDNLKQLSDEFLYAGFKLLRDDDGRLSRHLILTDAVTNDGELSSVTADMNNIAAIEEQQLMDCLPFVKDKVISSALITAVMDTGNFRVRKRIEDGRNELVIYVDGTQSWVRLGVFDNQEQSSLAAHLLHRRLAPLICKQNRIFIIDNILLRHALRHDGYGYKLLNGDCNHRENPEYFFQYNYTITVITCGSFKLIGNEEYRKFIKKTVRSNTPAHIVADFIWLTPFDMAVFEEIYRVWIRSLINAETGHQALSNHTRELMVFLNNKRNESQD